MEMDEAFGYGRTIRNEVVMKCTKGIPDKVSTYASVDLLYNAHFQSNVL